MSKGRSLHQSQNSSAAASRVSQSQMKASTSVIKSKANTPNSSIAQSLANTGKRLTSMVKSLFNSQPLVPAPEEPSESTSEIISPPTKHIPGKSQGMQTNQHPVRAPVNIREKESVSPAHAIPATQENQIENLFPVAIATLATMANVALTQARSNPVAASVLPSSLLSSQGLSTQDLALSMSGLQQQQQQQVSLHPSLHPVTSSRSPPLHSTAQMPPSLNHPSYQPLTEPPTNEQEFVVLPASIVKMYLNFKNKGVDIAQPVQSVSPARPAQQLSVRAATSNFRELAQLNQSNKQLRFNDSLKDTSNLSNSSGSLIQGTSSLSQVTTDKQDTKLKMSIPATDPNSANANSMKLSLSDQNQPSVELPKKVQAFTFGAGSITNKDDLASKEGTTPSTTSASKPISTSSLTQQPNKESIFSFSFGSSDLTKDVTPSTATAVSAERKTNTSTCLTFDLAPASKADPNPPVAKQELPPMFGAAPAKPEESSAITTANNLSTFGFGSQKDTIAAAPTQETKKETAGFSFQLSSSTTTVIPSSGFTFEAPKPAEEKATADKHATFSFMKSSEPLKFENNSGNTSSRTSGQSGFTFGFGPNANSSNNATNNVFGSGIPPFGPQQAQNNSNTAAKPTTVFSFGSLNQTNTSSLY